MSCVSMNSNGCLSCNCPSTTGNYYGYLSYILNCICGEMISVFNSSVVGHGFEPGRVKPKTVKLVFA
jgi:hypothetical protein